MATSSAAGAAGWARLGRTRVMLALLVAIAAVLLLLPHLDRSSGTSETTGDVTTVEGLDQCRSGGGDGCTVPRLRLCLQGDAAVSCDDLVVTEPSAASSSDGAGSGDALLVALVVLAPFALVLGPLGWRAARRTRRRNAAAFAGDAEACEALGFEVAPDPAPAVFALEQAWHRAARALVRPGATTVWLLESERPTSLVFDSWPTRSAVFVPEAPMPSGALVPMRDRGGASRFRGTFPRSSEADALVQAVGPLLNARRGQAALVVGGGLVEVRAVAAPRSEPLALSVLAELALEVAAALADADAAGASV